MSRQYVTTAIDYPNAAPHMGHVLEKVLADVCARWFRLRGDEVLFQIGTDEHGIKIQQTAVKAGLTPRELVDRNVPLFKDLYSRLHISSDNFIRTSDQEMHWPTVKALWTKLQEANVLEKRTYTGLYCPGCERFITKKELVDGTCPDHQIPPQEVEEENYFFLLSKETEWLKKLLSTTYHIIPQFREQETMALLERGLEDVSFSRPKSSLAWGIPVPGDENQTMYVWCDALTNYISGLDYFGLTEGHERPDGVSRLGVEWWDEATVTHVIGKDIARFHALIWPAMLKHAGVKVPNQLLIHGFLTSEGQKMSKSIGNVVVPDEAIDTFGVDALRFYLSHEIPVGNDGDFSWKRFLEVYDSILRNKLGNLLQRTLVLLQKDQGKLLILQEGLWPETLSKHWNMFNAAMASFEISKAVQETVRMMEIMNKHVEATKPWEMNGENRCVTVSEIAEFLRHISLMLLPFIPDTAQKISTQLNVPYADRMLENDFVITEEMKQWGSQKDWKKAGDPSILFPPRST